MGQLAVSDKPEILKHRSVSFDERKAQNDRVALSDERQRERAKHSPFSRWTQFNNAHTKELMWLAVKHSKAHAILYFLVDQMDEYNAVICSYKVLEEVLEISKATVQRNLQVLKENGFIAILKSGTSNVYAINDSVYWKSWGNNRRYSKFPANVVLALSEQEDRVQLTFPELTYVKHKEVNLKPIKTEDIPGCAG
jgi:DNA-binding transcriptional ArsR family regulator